MMDCTKLNIIMHKTFRKIGSFAAVMGITAMLLISFSGVVNAQVSKSADPKPGVSNIGGSTGSTKIQDNTDTFIYVPLDETAYGDFAQLSQTTPTGMLNEFVYGIVGNMKYILGTLAVLFIILSAIKLIIMGDNEESVGKQKTAMIYGIIGLTLVMMSDEFAKVLSVACAPGEINCARGGFLSDPGNMIQQAGLFKQGTRILITFVKYIAGSFAVIMIVRNGIRLVALAGKDEAVELDKKNLVLTSVGLVIIALSSTVIDKVLYVVDITKYSSATGVESAINPGRGIEEMVGITNFVVNIVAPAAILVLIAGAVMYATAGGNEEQTGKAKRLILLAVVGMVLIYGAFAIISTVISGQFIP